MLDILLVDPHELKNYFVFSDEDNPKFTDKTVLTATTEPARLIQHPSETLNGTIFFMLKGGINERNNIDILNGAIIDKIPDDWIPFINDGVVNIVVDTCAESWSPHYKDQYYWYPERECVDLHELLTDKCIFRGINPRAVTWITGDLNAEEYLKDFAGVKVKSHCIYYWISNIMCRETLGKDFLSHLGQDTFKNTSLCLMRDMHKEHRLYTVYKMFSDHDLGHKIRTSTPEVFLDNTVCNHYKNLYHYYTDKQYTPPFNWDDMAAGIMDYYTFSPFTIENDDIDKAQRESLFAVVSESFSFGHKKFITYSTFRAILSCRPFVILGNRGVLKQLKDWGFKTFDNILDESYDDIEDNYLRIDTALNSFKNYKGRELKHIEVFQEVRDIVRHNYIHYCNNYIRANDDYIDVFRRQL